MIKLAHVYLGSKKREIKIRKQRKDITIYTTEIQSVITITMNNYI